MEVEKEDVRIRRVFGLPWGKEISECYWKMLRWNISGQAKRANITALQRKRSEST